MSILYFKVQTKNEAIPLFKTIKEVGNYNTALEGNASPNHVYEIEYEDASFEILSVRIKYKVLLEVPYKSLSQCEFIHLPLEVQKEMVNRSSSKSIIPFLRCVNANHSIGGFDWNETPEGLHFWASIISKKQFDLFFQSKECKENIKSLNLKLQQNENQLQRKEIPHNGGSRQNTTGVLCRRCKARITVRHLGHQKIVGRG